MCGYLPLYPSIRAVYWQAARIPLHTNYKGMGNLSLEITGEDVRDIRQAYGLSKVDFAAIVGYTVTNIKNVENAADRKVSKRFKEKLYEKFNLTDELVLMTRDFMFYLRNPEKLPDEERWKPRNG